MNVHALLTRSEKFLQQATCARLLRKTEFKAARAASYAADDALVLSELSDCLVYTSPSPRDS